MNPTDSSPPDPVVARAARLNMCEFAREMARWSGAAGEIAERDGVLLYRTATEFPVTCNGVMRLDPRTEDAAVLAIAEEWFGSRGRGYTLQVEEPDGRDAGLAELALGSGLHAVGNSPAMIRSERISNIAGGSVDDAADRAGVELRWVGAGASVADFVAVSDAAYQSLGMPAGVITELCVDEDRLLEPHLHTVVAYDQDRPLAAAQLLLSHGIGGVYYVGTVEAARGRGLGELVTATVTNRSFELGGAFASLQATAMGEPIYRRMGYVQIGRYAGLVRFAAD